VPQRRHDASNRLGRIISVLVAVGGVWYAFAFVLSALVYEPVRVSPRDLGLTSPSIVAQVTVGVLVSGVIGLLLGLAGGAAWAGWQANRDPDLKQLADRIPLPFISDDPASNEAAVTQLRSRIPELSEPQARQAVRALHDANVDDRLRDFRASVPADVSDEVLTDIVRTIDRDVPRLALRVRLIWQTALLGGAVGLITTLCLGAFLFVVVAFKSRDDIRAGRAPGFVLGLPAPWPATVAEVRPVSSTNSSDSTTGLPPCALFLGEADSTVYLRDGGTATIRVPASTVRLVLTSRRSCH
jgi:hypothetical protein